MSGFEPGDAAAVQQLFDAVAPRYDQLNDLLSLGLHRLWKRQAIAWVNPAPGQRCLDLCCGTGDLALLLAARVRPGGAVLGLDAAAAPLALAARRARRQPWLPLQWQQGDAQDTGLPAARADGAVMAYGLRNLADPAAGLAELRRVLRPGARAAVLDFNRIDLNESDLSGIDAAGSPGREALLAFQRFYLRRIVVPVARAVDLEEHYAYLEASLRRFPTGQEQEQLALGAGFAWVQHRPLAAGLMGLLLLVA